MHAKINPIDIDLCLPVHCPKVQLDARFVPLTQFLVNLEVPPVPHPVYARLVLLSQAYITTQKR